MNSSQRTDHSGTPGARSAPLDVLRLLAAVLIVLFHFKDDGPIELYLGHPILQRGYLATDFFLILSGYVLGRSYGPKILAGLVSDDRFVLRRILRVWPAHLIMLSAFAAVILLTGLAGRPSHHEGDFLWRNLPAQLFLMQAWGFNSGDGWNVPTWSMSALLVCYAAFPPLWRGLRRVGGGPLLFATGLAAVWIADLLLRRFAGQGIYDLTFHFGVLRALPLFGLGLCIARAGEQSWPGKRLAPYLAATAAVALIAIQFAGKFDLASIALLAIVIGAAGQWETAGSGRLARRAGDLSFSLYITHLFSGLIWFNIVRVLASGLHLTLVAQWILWALASPLAFLVAMAFDAVIDRPVQALLSGGLWRRNVPVTA